MDFKEGSVLGSLKNIDKMIVRTLIYNIEDISQGELNAVPRRSQMEILKYLLDNIDNVVYQRDLEEVLNLRRATISGVLATMEKNGFITRKTDETDTRTKKVMLTDKAKNVFENGKEHMMHVEEVALKGVSEEDVSKLKEILEKMQKNLKNEYESTKN